MDGSRLAAQLHLHDLQRHDSSLDGAGRGRTYWWPCSGRCKWPALPGSPPVAGPSPPKPGATQCLQRALRGASLPTPQLSLHAERQMGTRHLPPSLPRPSALLPRCHPMPTEGPRTAPPSPPTQLSRPLSPLRPRCHPMPAEGPARGASLPTHSALPPLVPPAAQVPPDARGGAPRGASLPTHSPLPPLVPPAAQVPPDARGGACARRDLHPRARPLQRLLPGGPSHAGGPGWV